MSTNFIENEKESMNNIRIQSESSPAKLMSINKSEEKYESISKETPAKDENLLAEEDISVTPSSTKIGINNITNLSSKIAFITSENEKLVKANSSKSEASNTNKIRQQTQIIDVQNVSFEKSKFVPLTESSNFEITKQYILNTDERARQLEQKRQRMIIKLKQIPKSNTIYAKNRSKKNIFSVKKKIHCVNKNNTKSRINTNGKQCEKNLDKNTTNRENTDNQVSGSNNVTNIQDIKKEENDKKLCTTLNKCNKDIQNNTKNVLMEANSTVNTLISTQGKIDEPKSNLGEYSATCNTSQNDVVESDRINDKKISEQESSKEYLSNINKNRKTVQDTDVKNKCNRKDNEIILKKHDGKVKDILKSKINQVKRDLFSDEENEQKCKISEVRKFSKDSEVQKKDNKQISNDNEEKKTVKTIQSQDPKEELPCVLECLQLVPASKTDNSKEKSDNNQLEEEINLNTSGPGSVVYHFIYDDSISTKKRRRRYGSSELKQHVKVQLSNDNYKEIVTQTLTATDYQEIYNMNPISRKKFINKKIPVKNIEPSNIHLKNGNFILKNDSTKPLATSSPVDKPLVSKFKKTTDKIKSVNDKDNLSVKVKVQSEKDKMNKDNLITKNHKRKISESSDDSQIKKKRLYDPRILLNNMDIDEFLTSVHGPT